MILLNPGPVNLSNTVRQALLRPDICHRESEFIALQRAIRSKLLNVYHTPVSEWVAALISGSGTASLEATIASLFPKRLLIINNGVYGARILQIAMLHGIDCYDYKIAHEQAIDLDHLAKTIDEQGSFSHLAVVHHETTTGRLNPLCAIGRLCKSKGIAMIVDAISSFAAELIDFDLPIAACVGTANKCLHGVPGVSFVLLRRSALKEAANHPAKTLYLDLHRYVELQEKDGTPFTPAVQCCYALDAALDEFTALGGWHVRRESYQQRMAVVRQGLTASGIKPMLPDAECASALNAFYLPEGMTYSQLHDALKVKGYVIYAGQGALVCAIFRIAVMGEIPDGALHKLTCAIAALLPASTSAQP